MSSESEHAAKINAEHQLVVKSAQETLRHAIHVGDLLLEARSQVQVWRSFVEDNLTFGISTAAKYMRLATYQAELPKNEDLTVYAAMQALVGLAPFTPSGARRRYEVPKEALREARRLRKQGTTWAKIGEELGLSASVIRDRVDPVAQRQRTETLQRWRHERMVGRKELKRRETARIAATLDGPMSAAYSNLRLALADLDRAIVKASGQQRVLLKEAMSCAHHAEDHITEAMRTASVNA